ncbi:hypothetical protein IHE44_0000561 [Lamprotornis superbus]|uniref:Uncharacterized protein n=1 Tax=Lamprotornis superbus TaxID=245042 RepID=A0A835P2P1_9PASS|nr:hypothetical protein IHE44_0000561 [Lamprotornis superbus]
MKTDIHLLQEMAKIHPFAQQDPEDSSWCLDCSRKCCDQLQSGFTAMAGHDQKKKKSIQFEHKPNVNVDWTGESIWPSLHLPEKEEMRSYFIRKEKKILTQYQEAKPEEPLTSPYTL